MLLCGHGIVCASSHVRDGMVKLRRRSLRVELIASLAVVLMMAAVSLSLVSELLGRQRHEQQELARMREHAHALASLLAPLFGAHPDGAPRMPDAEQLLRPSLGVLGIFAIEMHRVMPAGSQRKLSIGLVPALPPPAPEDVAEARVDVSRRDTEGFVVVDQPIRVFLGNVSEPATMVLRLAATLSPWTRERDWQEALLVALGIGLVLLVLGGLLVEVQVLRPLRALRTAASEVALGHLDTKVPSEGPRELEDLAHAFNQMTDALVRQLEQIEQQRTDLSRAERLASVGRISTGVAHEIGNPLAAISGYLELLRDARTIPALPSEQRELLERMHTQIQRIQAIVQQLLDYARPVRSSPRPIELYAFLRDTAGTLCADPRTRGVTIDIDPGQHGEPVWALADIGPLEQVLHNLAINACHAVHKFVHARVVLRAGLDDQRAWIEVQDNGPGIVPEHRAQLFQPFFSTRKAGEGTGLGLAISQGLVEAMAGTLACLAEGARPPARQGEPAGATFRVELPGLDHDDEHPC